MLLKSLYLTIFAVVSVMAKSRIKDNCFSNNPFEHHTLKYTEKRDDMSLCASAMEGVKKLQENQVIWREKDIMKVVNEWNAFVSHSTKQLGSISPKVAALNECNENLTRIAENLKLKVKELEAILMLTTDDKTDSPSTKEKTPSVIDNMKGDIEAVNRTVETLTKTMEQCEHQMNETSKNQTELFDELKSELDTLKNDFETIIKTVKQNKTHTDKTVQTHSDDLKSLKGISSKINVVEETANANKQTIEQEQTRASNRYRELKELSESTRQLRRNSTTEVQRLSSDIKHQGENVDHNERQTSKIFQKQLDDKTARQNESLSALEMELDKVKSNVKANNDVTNVNKHAIQEQQEFTKANRQEIRKLQQKADLLQEKLDSYGLLRNNLLLVLCVMSVVVIVYLVIGKNPEMKRTAPNVRPLRRREPNEYNLTWQGPKENSVCVVTFCSVTGEQHLAETRSVFESVGATPPTIHTRVIDLHTDIQDLPGSRIFLVFVDFNQRNVILENPTTGGNLRLTTVKSLLRFGGDVSVIYCGDRGSRSLDRALFNPDLTSINSQQELSQLRDRQRMFSIYESFSNYQKEHCREFINRQLRE